MCKKCGQAYCVSSFLNQGIRDCPHCGKSTAVYQNVKKEWDSLNAKRHIGNEQTTTRLTFKQKWLNQNVYVTFSEGRTTYRYPHDEVLQILIDQLGIIKGTRSWERLNGYYNVPQLSETQKEILAQYIVE